MPSESSSTDFTRCQCGHFQMNHRPYAEGGCRNCGCDGFKLPVEDRNCDHSTCGWKPRYYGPDGECLHPAKRYTGTLYDGPGGRKTWLYYSCPDCKSSWKDEEKPEHRCNACGHTEGEGCGCSAHAFVSREHCDRCEGTAAIKAAYESLKEVCRCGHLREAHRNMDEDTVVCSGALLPCSCYGFEDEDPPLTPEEEEEADAPCTCSPRLRDERYELVRSVNCPSFPKESAPPPPQPKRRPPRLIAYSVQGHLYEVALPGDATVVAQDGALIITHALGPVAGIVQAGPLEGEQSQCSP